MSPLRFVPVVLLLTAPAVFADGAWRALWNGRDLSGWTTWLGRPEPTDDLPGFARSKDGRFLEPLGVGQDPLRVFSVVTADGRPAIRISGQVPGTLSTSRPHGGYHLRLQFKWGDKKWPHQLKSLRDSAIFFHGYDLSGMGAS